MSVGLQNLGGAQYTVTVNTQQVGPAVQQVQQQVQQMAKEVEKSGRQAAMGLLYMSQAIEDLQYGFSAIVNNIPLLVMSMGGSAGVAGAVSIAAVAVNQLIKHWDDLADRMKAAWSGTTIEQLAKIREAAEGATKAYEELAKAHSKAQQEAIGASKEAIVEGPLDAVARGLAQTLTLRLNMLSEEQIERMGRLSRGKGGMAGAMTQVTGEEARRLLGAATDPNATEEQRQNARTRINELVRINPGAFPPGFQMWGPQELKNQAEQERAVKEHNEERRRNTRDRVAKAEELEQKEKKRNEETDRLNEQGQQEEKKGRMRLIQEEIQDTQLEIRRKAALMPPAMAARAERMALGIPEQVRPSEIMSTKQYADKILTAGMDAVPKKQLDELVKMNKRLDDLKKLLDRVGALE